VDGLIVKKYGGTSVGSIERIESLADRLTREIKLGQKPVVVVSAMSGETNRLIALAEKIDPDYRGSAYDMLIASGEQVSISLLAIALQKRGIKAQPFWRISWAFEQIRHLQSPDPIDRHRSHL
jgi:aspartate kinase